MRRWLPHFGLAYLEAFAWCPLLPQVPRLQCHRRALHEQLWEQRPRACHATVARAQLWPATMLQVWTFQTEI